MWTCSKCSNQNWDSANVCAKCKDPISPELEKAVIARTQSEIKNHKPKDYSACLSPADPQASLNCEKLRNAFEGREAFYFEKGALRVRVFNIRYEPRDRLIKLEVEEIPTLGLEHTPLHHALGQPSPLRWSIGAGYLAEFSEQIFLSGYGGWELYFAPEVVRDLISVAANWPDDLEAFERYRQAREKLGELRFNYGKGEQMRRVFSELEK